MSNAPKFYMSDRPQASMNNGGSWMPGMAANAANIHIDGGPVVSLAAGSFTYELVAGKYAKFDNIDGSLFTQGNLVDIVAPGYSYYFTGYISQLTSSSMMVNIESGSAGDIFKPTLSSSYYTLYGHDNDGVVVVPVNNITIADDFNECKLMTNADLSEVAIGTGICVKCGGANYYGYIYDITYNATWNIWLKLYREKSIILDDGLYTLDSCCLGGHWNGSEIHNTIFPDYSHILIEGHIKPYPHSYEGSVIGLADHLMYMAVDRNGQYSSFGAIIDNTNMATSNLFYTRIGNYGFGQPFFCGLIFKASSYQKDRFPFNFTDIQDIQFYECEFDLGTNLNAAISVDYRSDGSEWEGNISFNRCILNGGQGLVNWAGTGDAVLLPKGELIVNDCIIHNTTSNALSWVTQCHNNLIYNCTSHGIITARHCHTNVSVKNNTIINCGHGIWAFPVDTPGTGQIGPMVITGNIVWGTNGRGIGIGRGYGPVLLEDNIVWDHDRSGAGYLPFSGMNPGDLLGDTTELSHQSYPVNLVITTNNRNIHPLLDQNYRPQIDGPCDLGNGRYIGCYAPVGAVDKIRERL